MHRHAKSCLLRYVVHQISLEKHLSWPSAGAPPSAWLGAAAAMAGLGLGHLQRSLPAQTTPWHKLSWRTDRQVIFCELAPAVCQELQLKLDFCETVHQLKIKHDLMLQFCLFCMYKGVRFGFCWCSLNPIWTDTLLSLWWLNSNMSLSSIWCDTVVPQNCDTKSWRFCTVSAESYVFKAFFSFLNGGQGCSVMSCCLSSLLLQRQKCTSEICRMHNCFLCWQG